MNINKQIFLRLLTFFNRYTQRVFIESLKISGLYNILAGGEEIPLEQLSSCLKIKINHCQLKPTTDIKQSNFVCITNKRRLITNQ